MKFGKNRADIISCCQHKNGYKEAESFYYRNETTGKAYSAI